MLWAASFRWISTSCQWSLWNSSENGVTVIRASTFVVFKCLVWPGNALRGIHSCVPCFQLGIENGTMLGVLSEHCWRVPPTETWLRENPKSESPSTKVITEAVMLFDWQVICGKNRSKVRSNQTWAVITQPSGELAWRRQMYVKG